MKKLLVSAAVLSASAIPLLAVATPASASVAPHISCTYNRLGTVNANLLKVHTTPNGSNVIGDFAGGQTVEFCATPSTTTGGYTWVWTTGTLTNGHTGSGYVAESYLSNIRRIS